MPIEIQKLDYSPNFFWISSGLLQTKQERELAFQCFQSLLMSYFYGFKHATCAFQGRIMVLPLAGEACIEDQMQSC